MMSIWSAGVDAVRPEYLIRNAIRRDGQIVNVCDEHWNLSDGGRIVVVGAGKAGAAMAAAVESILGPEIVASRVIGWVNVPEDCVTKLQKVIVHSGRPAGLNEPTTEGVKGTEQILKLVGCLRPKDLCIYLLSGGGSALLVAPIEGISLSDKQMVTRYLAASGAVAQDLNGVRKRLSKVKGGGLARMCRTGSMTTLIISDVIGDPIDVIASAPTVFDSASPQAALDILYRLSARPPAVPQAVFDVLEREAKNWKSPEPLAKSIRNFVIGNNSVALDASAAKAKELGYDVISLGSANEGEASCLGKELYRRCRDLMGRSASGKSRPTCVLSGGEATVKLPEAVGEPRLGGRNQQLVLAAMSEALSDSDTDLSRLGILSAGTDGEDGPTNAAGAYFDAAVLQRVRELNLSPLPYVVNCDAYHFFEKCNGLIKTGPTNTNVMDLRLALVE